MLSLLIALLQGQGVPPRLILDHKLATEDMEIGLIADADIAPDGSIYLLDQSNRRIYRFSPTGELVDSMGRQGKGPGEFEMAGQLEVGPHGEVAIVDITNRRLTVWGRDGRVVSTTPLADMVTDLSWSGDGLYHKSSSWDGSGESRFIRQGSESRVVLVGSSVSCDFCDAVMGPGSTIFLAAPDTVYAVHQVDSLGHILRTFTRTRLTLARWSEDELKTLESQARRRGIPWNPESFRFKRPLMVNSIAIDGAERVWLRPTVPDGSGAMFDVFQPDAKFLGTVRVVESLVGFAIRGNRVVGWGEDPDGLPAVWVYRSE